MVLRELRVDGEAVQRVGRLCRAASARSTPAPAHSTPLRMMRSLPLRSATSTRAVAAGNARLQGWNSPVATVTTRILPPGTSITWDAVVPDEVCADAAAAAARHARATHVARSRIVIAPPGLS